jgi:4-aminobutyrate aminotransferase and related aminotransferases
MWGREAMKEIHANANLKQAAEEHLVRYGGDQFENLFTSARGSVVIDDNGREILDFTSGKMCATVGHNHPAIVQP